MFPINLRINSDRFQANFRSLAQIGASEDGGINRTTFSPAHLQAREWFRDRITDANLELHMDSAGNHSAILRCISANAPTLLLGSHLDSVPNGGMFDGALGVLAALEVLQTVQDEKLSLPFHLEAIDFTDEEGTLMGFLGSGALTGKLTTNDLLEPRGSRQTFLDLIALAGLTEDGLYNARRNNHSLVGYLELHIEQGEHLCKAEANIGIVTNIVGIGSYQIIFTGRANHSGTTSMQSRLDAAQGVSAFTLEVRKLIIKDFPDCVANIGNISIEPGAFNIVPERAIASLEYRAPTTELLEHLETALLDLAKEQAKRFNLDLETKNLGLHPPAPMDIEIQAIFKRAAHTLGLSAISMNSGAGHDAQLLVEICPAGMVFVPSIDGISHSPREYTTWSDCVNGANMLLLAVLDLSSQY